MVRETNLIDISKITLENYTTYNERIKYEIPRQWGVRNIKPKRKAKSTEERKQYIKEYQHKYYLEVTKKKRRARKEVANDKQS